MIKVMRTTGKDTEFMSKAEINPMHLFIVSGENCNEEHAYGDLLTNSDSDIKFAILGKEYIGAKMNTEAVRTGIIMLIKHIKETFDVPPLSIVINRHQFRNEHEIEKFECIFSGVVTMMMTNKELEGLSLIITNYDEEKEKVDTKEN